LAKRTIIPPKIPTLNLLESLVKHGAMYTPRNEVKPTMAVVPYKDKAVARSIVYNATNVIDLADIDDKSMYESRI
jgi:hypothetical protein